MRQSLKFGKRGLFDIPNKNGKPPVSEASHVTNWYPGTQYLIPKHLRHFPAKRQRMSWVEISARWFPNPFQRKYLHLTMPYQTVRSPHSCSVTAQGSRNIPILSQCKIYLLEGVPIPAKHCYTPPRVHDTVMSL